MRTQITLKNIIKITLFFSFIFFTPQKTNAQFLKKLLKKAEKKVEKEAEKRSEKRINKSIDKGFDKVEDKIDGNNKKESKKQKKDSTKQSERKKSYKNEQISINNKQEHIQPKVVWSRFDFVPGDTVLFEDKPNINEENGEFPSRWDMERGSAEMVEVNNEKVISFPQGGTIVPYLKNANEDYLPEIFTIELDVYFRPKYSRRLYVKLWDKKNQRKNNNNYITFYINSASTQNTSNTLPNTKGNWSKNGGWRHLSISFTKGKLKAYINDTRLINIPHYPANPTGVSIEMEGYSSDKPEDLQYIKNIRIAKGGVKYYDRVLSEGKIIVNGIKFDVNKTTLKPESIGPINKIYKLMTKQAELKFSIEGHTDSDGSEANNQTLSEGRAKTVMNQLIKMGINPNRLTSKGWGESKPITENNSAEGKANNRRVEFVKF